LANIVTKMEKAKGLLTQKGYGSGIERMAYYMNESLPCMSPIFDRDYVPNLDYLLPALNRYARLKADDIVSLIDHDIIAYISVHFKHQITNELRDLNSSQFAHHKVLAEISILAKLQESSVSKRGMTDLCSAAAIILKPAVEHFHSTQRRKRVYDKIPKAISSGKLSEVLAVINDKAEKKQDSSDFDIACAAYSDAVHGQIDLHNDVTRKGALATEVAGQISSALSGLFAVLVAFGYAIFSVF